MPRRPTVYDGFVSPDFINAQDQQDGGLTDAPAGGSPWMQAPPQMSGRQTRLAMFNQRLMGNPNAYTPAMQGRIATNNPGMYTRMFGARDQALTNLTDANTRANALNTAGVGALRFVKRTIVKGVLELAASVRNRRELLLTACIRPYTVWA